MLQVEQVILRCLFPFSGDFLKIYQAVFLTYAFAIDLFDLNELHARWIVEKSFFLFLTASTATLALNDAL